MRSVHIVIQGKGGVGKTFISSILAQYYLEKNVDPVHCFDTDPVNRSFSQIAALKVELINILNKKNEIDARQFDPLVEKLISVDGIRIIDNGSTSFIPLLAYMNENGVVDFLREAGTTVYCHVPLQGGQAFGDTILALAKVLKSLKTQTVVWLNNFQGQVVDNVQGFQDMGVYKSNKALICGIVDIPDRSKDTFGMDIRSMTAQNLTFDEVTQSDKFFIMSKQRILMFKRGIYEQLDAINFGEKNESQIVEKERQA
ncbi:conjugal transfer protein TraL [Advenella sp. FME57]|uniref:nucleotide-binding protein n=1 Tax=Advenella sp. FME57 TaxID=2742604 RepID=UPI0018677534|nr:conjugal transfer protein TraL [Advenella sp. FME57]